MQTLYKRFSVIGCFALLIVILLVDSVITKRQLDIQIATGRSVTRARKIRLELSQTESLIKDAETGQRGFLYTGDAKYLAPYDLAVSQVDSHIDALALLTSDNPHEQALIAPLRTQARAKLDELAETIALYKSGKQEDAKNIVLGDSGLVFMNNIRDIVGHMQSEELTLEASRQAAYERSIRITVACIYFAGAFAAIALIVLAYYIMREMTLREKHAQELRAREELFRVTLTSIGDAVIATDKNSIVTFLNPIAEEMTGLRASEAIGRAIGDVFPIFNETTLAPVANPVTKVVECGRVVGLANHTVLRKPDGSLTPIDDSAAPIRDDRGDLVGVVLVFRDITSNRKTEEVLRKTEKLAAAARLSATVAHEINNPLEAALSLVYISRTEPGLPERVVNQLTQAEQEMERVAHITRQTLGFYRDSNSPGPIQLEPLIESVFRLYSNKFRKKQIRIERNFGDCPDILGAEGELKQVLSNLVSNAADAVSNSGTICVSLECIESLGSTVVQMIVEDDGPGVSEDIADRIFEPFFTTKQDVGTGLGLWVSKEIIERYGGNICADSRGEGKRGVAFKVTFPAKVLHSNGAS